MSEIKVMPVPEGSIVWLNDIDFLDEEMLAQVKGSLVEACGHDRFILFQTFGGGVVEVLGSPDELVERVRASLDVPDARDPGAVCGAVGVLDIAEAGDIVEGRQADRLTCVRPAGHDGDQWQHEDPDGLRWSPALEVLVQSTEGPS